MISKSTLPLLTAREAADALGVSTATLYAYVSRGMLRSEPGPAGHRERRYRREDVERLQARKAARRDPGAAARRSLDWGMPVIESAITAIEGGRLFYRGHDVIELAATRRFEEVAALLLTGELVDEGTLATAPGDHAARLAAWLTSHDLAATLLARADLGGLERAQSLLPLAGAADPQAWDLRPAAAARTSHALPPLVAAAVAGVPPAAGGAATTLAAGWRVDPARVPALEAALVLCADHELNVSAFTARCVASAGGNAYDAVAAALGALKGHRHGGVTARVEALLAEAERVGPRRAVEERLRRGEEVPGFGHPLYPGGDPRARALLEIAGRAAPAAGTEAALAAVEALAAAAGELLDEAPSLDVGLVALARALALPPGAPVGVFATGRTAGWAAHVVEEQARARLIRPRARYVGARPRI